MIEHTLRVLGGFIFLLTSLLVLNFLVPLQLCKLLPFEFLQAYVAKTFLSILGIKVVVSNKENVPRDAPVVFMYNHTSNLDLFTLVGWSPICPSFIYKKELLWLCPPLGIIGLFYGHVPIDRQQPKSAIKCLDKAVKEMKECGKSIAISPEGTRSFNGELGPFKKGAFHIAIQAEAYVVPTLLTNNFSVWPRTQLFPRQGTVGIKFLQPIRAKKSMNVDDLLESVRKSLDVRPQSSGANPPVTLPNDSATTGGVNKHLCQR